LITEAKMPQKLIPNHRTINSKQLLKLSLVYIENCFQGCFSGFMGKIANLSYYLKEALKLPFYFAQF
ncbi:hypothetical protein, partial [uncultured Phocaeicola sp.]|uniref:hypothetical protein n=1 Tax=uncultured Phocaeicola sp. TaxID=990718 RepID=UPI0025DE6E36